MSVVLFDSHGQASTLNYYCKEEVDVSVVVIGRGSLIRWPLTLSLTVGATVHLFFEREIYICATFNILRQIKIIIFSCQCDQAFLSPPLVSGIGKHALDGL